MGDWQEKNDFLTKEFTFDNFPGAIAFINKIEPLAEGANHHPDILLHGYRKVKIMLRTHDANAITERDHQLAAQIDQI